MTDRSKQHCGHECNGEVCYSYRDYQSDDLDPCLAVKCQHDTRTHSAAPDVPDDLSKIDTKTLIGYYSKILNEIENRGVTW